MRISYVWRVLISNFVSKMKNMLEIDKNMSKATTTAATISQILDICNFERNINSDHGNIGGFYYILQILKSFR